MKKNILFLSLVLLVCCSSCKKEIEVSPSPMPSEVVETNEPEYVLKGDFLDIYRDMRVSEESKFLGTAIVMLRPEEYQYDDIPIIDKEQENSDLIFTLLHLDSDYLDEFALSASDSYTRAYTFAIIKPNIGYEENILLALEQRMSDLEEKLKNYPDQLYIINNAVITQVGDYIVFIACDNAEDVFKELYKVMEETDLSIIKPIPLMTDEERKEIENKYLQEQIIEIESQVKEIDFIENIDENSDTNNVEKE